MKSVISSQRGGTLAFVIVGVVLLGLLAGGIYVSKNQGRRAMTSPTDTQVAQNPKPVEKNNTDTNGSTPKTEQDQKPQEQEKKDNNQQTGRVDAPEQTGGPQTGGIASTGPSTIASTGPADAVLTAIALGTLAAGVGAYLRSNSQLHRAALK